MHAHGVTLQHVYSVTLYPLFEPFVGHYAHAANAADASIVQGSGMNNLKAVCELPCAHHAHQLVGSIGFEIG